MNLTKEVTKEIINQADQAATSIIINDFNESDNAVFCSLINVDYRVITSKRVFTFEELPCQELNHGEKELIKGMSPTDEWYIEEIKLWLDSQEIEYQSNDLKAQLLMLII